MNNLPQHFDRKNGRVFTDHIKKLFLEHYQEFGCTQQSQVPITCGMDDSVHFIGAAVSVLKPFLSKNEIIDNGFMLAQECLRARNVNKLLLNNFSFEWGACFTNIELVTPYENLDKVCSHTFSFFYDKLAISPENMVVRVSAQDKDLLSLCKKNAPQANIEIDTFSPQYYTHSIGMPQFKGRNFNFALKYPENKLYKDVGNFIVFSDENDQPAFIEVGFGDTTILKEIYGLDHILDCFPVPEIPCENKADKRIIEDTIIATTALYREGLRPSSKDAQSKILYKYIRAFHHIASKNGLGREIMAPVIDQYEKDRYSDYKGVAKEILDFIDDKKLAIEALNIEALQRIAQENLSSEGITSPSAINRLSA